MNAYALALFLHLVFLLVASVASTLAMLAALRLRTAGSAGDALPWLAFIGRVVRAFPVAVLGLLATGGYMTHQRWSWSIPWIDTALVGLALIVALGSGVEGARARLLGRELESAGMSERARRLLRDPVFWSAKLCTLTVALAVVFVMTVKPGALECVAMLAGALVAGVLSAVPFWRRAGNRARQMVQSPST